MHEQTTKYQTILADPPWTMGQRGQRGAEAHYSLLELDAIKRMPVADLAAERCHLWLWATNASLPAAHEVIEAWGFEYRSMLTWIKPRLGLGNYLRNMTEHCLLATVGKAPVQTKAQGTWMFAPVQRHSQKPEEMFDIIERVSGKGPSLELFARRPRHAWDAWGAEIASAIDIPGYPVPDSPATRKHS